MDDRRRHRRIPVSWAARVITARGERSGVIQDISAGGCFVQTPDPPRPGEQAQLLFHPLGEVHPPVAAVVVTAWTMDGQSPRAASGFGARWHCLGAVAIEPLRALLHDMLSIRRGLVQVQRNAAGRRVFVFRFPPEGPATDVPQAREATTAPRSQADRNWVNIPARFEGRRTGGSGVLVRLSPRVIVVEVDDAEMVPGRGERVAVHAALQEGDDLYPITFHGHVALRKPAATSRAPRFWLRVLRVDEHGRDGLLERFLDHIDMAA